MTAVRFYIDGLLVATHTTHIPGAVMWAVIGARKEASVKDSLVVGPVRVRMSLYSGDVA